MKKILLFHFAFLSLLSPLFGESEDEKKWRAGLGSPDFSERTSAYEAIWAEGEEVIPFLKKLIEGEDPELSLRATSILRKVQLGITPETPEKIIRLIDNYFQTTRKGRVDTIEKLIAAKEYDIVLRLRKMEENEQVLARIDDEIAKAMPKIVAQHLEEDDVGKAKEFLLLSDQFEHLIHYASLLEYTGELEEEIVRLREDTPGASDERYLACLRVKGDPVLLREEALRLRDRDLANLASIVMGDHTPHFEALLENGDLKPVDHNYLEWSLAEGKGDFQSARKAQEAILHLSEQESERNNARAALFKMGLGDRVINHLGERELTIAIGYATASENYGRAQELIGIPEGEKADAWIAQTAKQAREELEQSDFSRSLFLLMIATEFLEDRGLIEEATCGAFALFDLGRDEEKIELSAIASDISNAPLSTLSAIAREIDEFEADFENFSGISLFSKFSSAAVLSLHRQLLELYPEMATRDRLFLTTSFLSSRLLVPVDLFTEARDRVLEKIADGEERAAESYGLFTLLTVRNRAEDLQMIAKAMREAGAPNVQLETDLATDLGNYGKASRHISKAKIERSPFPESYAIRLHFKGGLMIKGGLEEGEEVLEKARRFSNGSADVLRTFADHHLRFVEIDKAHELLKKALLRTSGRSYRTELRKDIVEGLAASAAQLGKWKEALAYRELKLFSYRVYRLFFGHRYRLELLVARGAVEMEAGNLAGAVRSFTAAHRLLPGDGYLANELFPVVRELGLIELHDQLFAETAEFCRENIRRYPKDDNLYNNFAWQASRANRALDEAEDYLTKGLELNPESAAYLDTMAEIEFARKNRAKAIEWSEKSLANQAIGSSRGRWELQWQNHRFKTGGFPVR